jgi:L-amino acid N-acyltransferase YncA
VSSTIRIATEYDAAQIQAIYEPYVIETPITFELDPPSESDMRRRIIETLIQYPWIVCEDSNGAIKGYAYAGQHMQRAAYRWSVNVSVYVDTQYHRQGVGRALYASLLALLPKLNFLNAYAGITLPNDKSVGLHEVMGFTPVGIYKNIGYKDGVWLDVGWWSMQLQQYVVNPANPVAFASVTLKPEIQKLVETGIPLLK